MIVKQISAQDSGLRIDRWFKINHPEYPFTIVAKLARKGKIKVNGKKANIYDRVIEGQEIKFFEVKLEQKEANNVPDILKYKNFADAFYKKHLIFCDEHITVINKPVAAACQGGSGISVGIDTLAKFWDKQPVLVHRLDKETSGVLVMANNRVIAKELSALFSSQQIKKDYLAVLKGHIVKKSIDTPVLDNGKYKHAITNYELLELSDLGYSLVIVSPMTGRKHQIRIHSAALGSPVVGDDKHGISSSNDVSMMLHSYRLRFELLGNNYSFYAELSDIFKDDLRKLGFKKIPISDTLQLL
ncbi:RluA family pseudouridine synthase [Candidatus Cyrtobacter comes]|uniref:Ribosomal large subunit pseudouridine synthase C n=1 Tax=Candidatus Cyrtobacter comes TaxID=675776 RepID=A0ABU5L7N5_9RICK|nr:RluA family pseudouridine synthase [Candidatus Cyrtobacter comes]MDZ5762133.1 RluA family pseudouridine synthase [Candidatus Cyrtobacter comes]